MVFRKLLGAMGVGGPSVDTQLTQAVVQPGGELRGKVIVQGGQQKAEIDYITLSLVTRIEVETDEGEYDSSLEFHRVPVSGGFSLAEGSQQAIDFAFPVPFETPVTVVPGINFALIPVGVRTELAVAKAVDKSDMDAIQVQPGPAQAAILAALGRLGFQVKGADLERGQIRGVVQTLPFYQEIEFYPSARFASVCSELELTFVARADSVDVILEGDKRGGLFSASRDLYHHLHVPQRGFDGTDWAAKIEAWLQGVGQSRR